MRAHELKEAKSTGFRIYCDMDGVVCDLLKGVTKFMADDSYGEKLVNQGYVMGHNVQSRDFWKKVVLVNNIDPEAVINIWRDLEWMPDGKKLWSYISKHDPIILSSQGTSVTEVIETGKKRWIEKNMKPQPPYIFEVDKWKYAAGKSGQQNILIDDTKKKIDPWIDNGGIGILHVSAADTIRQLKEWKL